MHQLFKLFTGLFFLSIIFFSCDALQKGKSSGGSFTKILNKPEAITSSFDDAVKEQVLPDDFGDKMKARDLDELPTGPNGGYLLSPGLYQVTSRSYCLHPGTAAPGKTKGDGYLFAPLKGDKAAIIESIMVNAELKDAWQQDVQALIWAVIAKASFKDMSPQLKQLATELLSADQIKELNKNAVKVLSGSVMAKLKAKMPPAVQKAMELENKMREEFSKQTANYEELEKMAVLPAEKSNEASEYKRGRWSKHPDGYYVRYFPNGYSELTMQVYMPDEAKPAPNTGKQSVGFFYRYAPKKCTEVKSSSSVAVPANKSQQRLTSAGQPKEGKSTPDPKSQVSGKGKQQKFNDPQIEADYQKYAAKKEARNQKPRERLNWKEVRDYFLIHSPIARGNAFNKKARTEKWYEVHELVLVNDYRLDSYVPDKEIISRKATSFEDITEETFRRYLEEMREKYAPGTVIKSNTFPELKGKKLKGKLFLEIPESNLCFAEIERYRTIAAEYKIELRFKPE